MDLFFCFVFTLCFGFCKSSINIYENYFLASKESTDSVILYTHGHQLRFPSYNNENYFQQAVMSKRYKDPLKYIFTRHVLHTQLITVEFSHIITDGNQSAYISMQKLFMTSKTVALLIDSQGVYSDIAQKCRIVKRKLDVCKFYETFMDTPSLKMLFTLAMSGDVAKHKFINNWFCFGAPNAIDISIFSLQRIRIREIHKTCYKFSNNRKINALIAHTNEQFLDETRSKAFSCDIMMKTRRFKDMSRAKYCWAKQMLGSELSKMYNLTYEYDDTYSYETLSMEMDVKYNLKSIDSEGMYLQYYSGWSYHYCLNTQLRNKTSQLGYDTFVKPMPEVMWLLLVTTWVILAVYFAFQAKYIGLLNLVETFVFELVATFGLVCCSGIKFKHRMELVIGITLGCLLFWFIYQNNIIGLTIVEEKIKPFQSNYELLGAGYKMAEGTYVMPHCDHSDIDSKNYVCLKGKSLSDYYFVVKKIAWLQQARWNLWYYYSYNADYQKEYGVSIICFYVKEEIQVLPFFLVILMNNRYWMIQTVNLIHEGGFMGKWNDMAFHMETSQNKEKFLEPAADKKPDSIKLNELWSVVLLCLGICVITWFVLFVEILVYCYKIGFGGIKTSLQQKKQRQERYVCKYIVVPLKNLNILPCTNVAGIKQENVSLKAEDAEIKQRNGIVEDRIRTLEGSQLRSIEHTIDNDLTFNEIEEE